MIFIQFFFGNCLMEPKDQNKIQTPQQKAERIYIANKNQLQQFKDWKTQGNWTKFHNQHYDWWAFPIDQKSSFGDFWKVQEKHIEILKKNSSFIQNLKECICLAARAWGYNIKTLNHFEKLQYGQQWSGWAIRLYKITKSALVFNLIEQYLAMRLFGLQILKKEQLSYGSRDFREFFQTNFIDKRKKIKQQQEKIQLMGNNYKKNDKKSQTVQNSQKEQKIKNSIPSSKLQKKLIQDKKHKL